MSQPGGSEQGDRDVIRASMRERRRALSGRERTAAEASAARHMEELLSDQGRSAPFRALAVYIPSDGEISPLPATARLRRTGWSIWLPVVGDDASMSFGLWTEDHELTPNRFGIGEPPVGSPRCGAEDLQAIIVPSVAIDRHGNRLGMGAGFYDRALAEVAEGVQPSGPLLIGLAFEFQVVDILQSQPWDVRMDVVISETGTRVVR